MHYDDHEMPFYPDGNPVVCHILEFDRFANNADALYTVNGDGKQRKLTPELFGWLREAQLRHDMWLHDRAQEKYDAREEGRAEGKAAGREMGLSEGLSRGRAEGRIEGTRETAPATARNFKTLGVSVQIIAQATGLTEDGIAKL